MCVQRGTGAFLQDVLHVYPSFLQVVFHVYPCISVCAEKDRRVFTSCPSCISLYRCVYRERLARFYELSFMYILVSCVQRWTGAFLRVVLHVYPCIRVCAENWHVSTSCPSCISLYPCVGLARFYELSFMYRPILVSLCVCRGGLSTSCPSYISLYRCVCREGLARFYELSFMYILVSLCAERDWHASTSCISCISFYPCVGLARFYELSFMYILVCAEGNWHVSTSCPSCISWYRCVCAEGNWHVSTSCPSCISLCVQRGTGTFLRVVHHVYPCTVVCVQRGTGTFLRVVLHVYPCIDVCVCAERDWRVSTSCPSCISLYPCVCREELARFYELSFMHILVSVCVQRGTGTFLRVVLHVYPCIRVCAERNWHVSTSCPSCISLYPCVCREELARFYELSFIYILVSLCVQRGTGTFLRVVLHVYPCIPVCAERNWRVSTSCPSCISLYPCVGLRVSTSCPSCISLYPCVGLARFYELSFMYILVSLCRAGAFLRVVLYVYKISYLG